MTRQVFLPLVCMAGIAAAAHAQTLQIPAQQARFCSILSNWKLRDGYAPGKEPREETNPIAAARAPKPPDPGDLFDQLVAILGTSGEFSGWKAKVVYVVINGAISVEAAPVCPEAVDISFSTVNSTLVPLQSPMADFLAKFQPGSVALISGHLIYEAKARFYALADYNPGSLRKGNPFSHQSPAEYFFLHPRRLAAQFTGLSK